MLLHLSKQIQSETGFSYFILSFLCVICALYDDCYVSFSLPLYIFNNFCHPSGGIDPNQVDLIKLSDVENILNLTILLYYLLNLSHRYSKDCKSTQ